MPRTIEVTLAIGVWVADGFRPAGAIIGMRPSHGHLLGVNLPDEGYARRFPQLPETPGLWVVTCHAELPAALDDEAPGDDINDILELLSPEQLYWLPASSIWRHADDRDLYILRGEVPPGERT